MSFSSYLKAANREGYGPESPVVTIFSAEDIPHVQPQSLIAMPYNSTAINATWSPISLTRENIRGKLIGHRVRFAKIMLTITMRFY